MGELLDDVPCISSHYNVGLLGCHIDKVVIPDYIKINIQAISYTNEWVD